MTKEQKLQDTIKKQQKSINKLNDRVSVLMDKMLATENDLAAFKKRLGKDMDSIIRAIKNK